MSNGIGLVIESLVSILLLLTICYCVVLNKRLKRLRADEQTLKATISELITATSIAERAIAGLKLTVRECDQGISERLKAAERFSFDIQHNIAAGELVLQRLAHIVSAARPLEDLVEEQPIEPAIAQDASATVLAARAFANRARIRNGGRAA